jgi:hypothetical protein
MTCGSKFDVCLICLVSKVRIFKAQESDLLVIHSSSIGIKSSWLVLMGSEWKRDFGVGVKPHPEVFNAMSFRELVGLVLVWFKGSDNGVFSLQFWRSLQGYWAVHMLLSSL